MKTTNGRLLLKGGHVVDPANGQDGLADLLIEHGIIAAIGPGLKPSGNHCRTIDAAGCHVLPGLIDLHVHFRQPGREDDETIATGVAAAALGGFTTVCPMPNTEPVIDTPSLVSWIVEQAARSTRLRVLPVAAVTKQEAGTEMTDFGELTQAGAIAFSDDGKPVADALVMRRALEYARMFQRPIMQHAEEPTLAHGGVMHEGETSTILGLHGIPAASESVMVARDLELAAVTGGHVHFAHLSSRRSIELVRQAKQRGVRVTCETCPHYFTLTDEAVRGYETRAKVNPPLKTADDVTAIIEGLRDGTIDTIATDHAPHAAWKKAAEFDQAPFGLVGLETALALAITQLIEPGHLTWPQLVEKMARQPARVLGIAGGTLGVGAAADVTIVDAKSAWTVEPERFASKGRNTPFAGWRLRGRVRWTIAGGVPVVDDGQLKEGA